MWTVINNEFPASADDEDLYQEGCIGLIQAADNWSEDKGTPFVSYAYGCIKHEICHVIRYRTRLQRTLFTQVSLSEKMPGTDGLELKDAIQGDQDVDYFDEDEFLTHLTKTERDIVPFLQAGYNATEIAHIQGTSRQNATWLIHTIRRKWKEFYGEQ